MSGQLEIWLLLVTYFNICDFIYLCFFVVLPFFIPRSYGFPASSPRLLHTHTPIPILAILWCCRWSLSGDEVSPGCLPRLAPLSSPLQCYAIRPHTQLSPVVGIWETPETWCFLFAFQLNLRFGCTLLSVSAKCVGFNELRLFLFIATLRTCRVIES